MSTNYSFAAIYMLLELLTVPDHGVCRAGHVSNAFHTYCSMIFQKYPDMLRADAANARVPATYGVDHNIRPHKHKT